jgi:serine/threonine protein kinase
MERIGKNDLELLSCIYEKTNYVYVWRARSTKTKEFLCVKFVQLRTLDSASRIQQECITLASLDHPNILRLRSAYIDPMNVSEIKIAIITDFYPEGDLSRLLNNLIGAHRTLSEDNLFFYLSQLVAAFTYMQVEKSVAHRDIKLENILVSDHGNKLIVGDLGSAAIKACQQDSGSIVGTLQYLSPQLRRGYDSNRLHIEYNPYKSDVYSLGITFLFLASRRVNFDLCLLDNLKDKINYRLNELCQEYPRFCGILAKMLEVDEDSRWDFVELNNVLQQQALERPLENEDQTIAVCDECRNEDLARKMKVMDTGKLCRQCWHRAQQQFWPKKEL